MRRRGIGVPDLLFFFFPPTRGGMLLRGGENGRAKYLLAMCGISFLTPSVCWGPSLAPAAVAGPLELQDWDACGPDT